MTFTYPRHLVFEQCEKVALKKSISDTYKILDKNDTILLYVSLEYTILTISSRIVCQEENFEKLLWQSIQPRFYFFYSVLLRLWAFSISWLPRV